MSTKRRKSCTQRGTGTSSLPTTMAGDEEFIMETRDALPAHLLIKIESFSMLTKHKIREYESKEFAAGGYKWKIRLDPNGCANEEGRSVSIFVYLDSKSTAPHQKVKANVCIRIKNKQQNADHSRNFTEWFTSAAPGRGYRDFIPIAHVRDPSKGFIVDDCCFVEAEILVQVVVSDPPELNRSNTTVVIE